MDENIKKSIVEILPKYNAIVTSDDFWFKALHDQFQAFKSYDISPYKEEIKRSIEKFQSKEKFGFQSFMDEIKNPDYYQFILIIGKLIAIIDQKGYNKKVWNPYEDKRHISLAQFTQKNWTLCFLLYKLLDFSLEKIPRKTYGTFHSAIEYLENPTTYFAITSSDIKAQIFNYFKVNTEEELKLVFSKLTPNTVNPLNQTYLYSSLIFDPVIQSYWKTDNGQNNEDKIKDNKNNNSDMDKLSNTPQPLNQILFGPPGTGKTYNSINKALEILEVNVDYKDRLKVKQLYDEKVKDGQIMFTTFHQSMSYEDFIEGIKPNLEGDNVSYEIVPGIFKIMVDRAKATTDNFYKMITWLQDKCLENDASEPVTIKTGNSEFTVSYRGGRTFRIKPKASNNPDSDYPASIENIRKVYEGGSRKEVYNPTYVLGILDYLYQNGLQKANKENKNNKPYVLIIDEINRGNVSSIFGELITLIEEDKRLGREEALEVILPYSKEKFGVPPNLYIIGTMNTADRSVEALDAALRRRFSFVEMPPLAQLIRTDGKLKDNNGILDDIDLADLLDTINNRIEMLLDKDHKIGHSYFMDVDSLDKLKLAFQNKIIPLLQEYFFGDYGKIGLVLGMGFIQVAKNDQNIFAKFDYDSVSDYTEKTIYTIKNFSNKDNAEFLDAINTLLKK